MGRGPALLLAGGLIAVVILAQAPMSLAPVAPAGVLWVSDERSGPLEPTDEDPPRSPELLASMAGGIASSLAHRLAAGDTDLPLLVSQGQFATHCSVVPFTAGLAARSPRVLDDVHGELSVERDRVHPEAEGEAIARIEREVRVPTRVNGEVVAARFVFAAIFLVGCR
jgi:hypothetical protein